MLQKALRAYNFRKKEKESNVTGCEGSPVKVFEKNTNYILVNSL